MTYSEKIKLARDKLLLSQEEMATALGVNSITVCRWETRKCEPNLRAKKAFRSFCEQNNLKFDE